MEKIHKINFGNNKDLPKEIRKEFDLKDDGLYKEIISEQAHIKEGVKNTLESAGYKVITERLDLKRDGKYYVHDKGEKVYYEEDIRAIIKEEREKIKLLLASFDLRESVEKIEVYEKE